MYKVIEYSKIQPKQFNLADYQEDNWAMVLETEEELVAFEKYLDRHNRCWCTGVLYDCTGERFKQYRSNTYYKFNVGAMGTMSNGYSSGYLEEGRVLYARDFLFDE